MRIWRGEGEGEGRREVEVRVELRTGWEFWRPLRASWRFRNGRGLLRWRARTVMPVPVGTALYQLYSVPDIGRYSGGVSGSIFVGTVQAE